MTGDGTTGARIVAAGMIVAAFVIVLSGWTFTATYTPPAGDNPLGIGWVVEAAFWVLRVVPGAVWAVILGAAGALCLHGLAVERRAGREA